jgi:hypothetical protein
MTTTINARSGGDKPAPANFTGAGFFEKEVNRIEQKKDQEEDQR